MSLINWYLLGSYPKGEVLIWKRMVWNWKYHTIATYLPPPVSGSVCGLIFAPDPGIWPTCILVIGLNLRTRLGAGSCGPSALLSSQCQIAGWKHWKFKDYYLTRAGYSHLCSVLSEAPFIEVCTYIPGASILYCGRSLEMPLPGVCRLYLWTRSFGQQVSSSLHTLQGKDPTDGT